MRAWHFAPTIPAKDGASRIFPRRGREELDVPNWRHADEGLEEYSPGSVGLIHSWFFASFAGRHRVRLSILERLVPDYRNVRKQIHQLLKPEDGASVRAGQPDGLIHDDVQHGL